VGTDAPRVIGPKEQHAIDTAPFSGLAQHYYALFLRKCDEVDRLRASVDATAALSDVTAKNYLRLRAVIENAPHDSSCQVRGLWILPARGRFAEQQSGHCTCWKTDAR
jgi:hypothetical protein